MNTEADDREYTPVSGTLQNGVGDLALEVSELRSGSVLIGVHLWPLLSDQG